MSDSIRISQMLYVGAALDGDGDLEMSLPECLLKIDTECYVFLDRSEILALITHLGNVLDAADKDAMK